MKSRRLLLNCSAAASAFLATLLFCGYLVTLRVEASVKPMGRRYGLEADLQNGRIKLGVGYCSFFSTSTGRFEIRGMLKPYFPDVEHAYWWGLIWHFNERTGVMGFGPRTVIIMPIWWVMVPCALFPLLYFGRKFRNPPGGFPVLAEIRHA